MKKILMSGECIMGYTGTETDLIDSYGNKLFIGDLVSLSAYDKDNPELFNDFYGVEFVCDNRFCNDGLEKHMFVMGIASDHKQKFDDFGGNVVCQNHKEWRLRRVKGYEELVDGERWGAVRVLFVEEADHV